MQAHTHLPNTHSVRRKQADRKNAYTQPSINETHVRILRIYRELLASNFSPSQCFVQVFPRVICVNDRCCTHARGARRHVITRTHARQRPKKKLFVGGAMPSHRPVADIIATRFASDGVATGGALMSANPINPGRLISLIDSSIGFPVDWHQARKRLPTTCDRYDAHAHVLIVQFD